MDRSCLGRVSPIQSARHAGESAPPTAPNGKRRAKRSPEVPTARERGPGKDGVAGDRKKAQVTGALRAERITADQPRLQPGSGTGQPAAPPSYLVRLVGLRGRLWLELNPSSRNGPVRWLGRSWHIDQ